MPTPAELHSTTQQFLDIYDITNDLVIMKDGSTSLIITVSAMNFGLLAEEEQDAIIYAYAGLLNSLNYPIQVVVKSQTKDATKYLNLLKEQEEAAQDRYKADTIRRYREFVTNLIHERNVLDKKFYVVIPASALEMGLLPPQSVVPGVKKIDISTIERSVILEKAINILEPKRDHLISQFARIGLAARQLTTQEIIQLFYTSYNPEAAEGQQITNTADYTTALVQAQVPADFAAAQTIPSTFGSPSMTDTNTTQPITPTNTTSAGAAPQASVPETPAPQVTMNTPAAEPTPTNSPAPVAEAPQAQSAPQTSPITPPPSMPNAGGTPAEATNPTNPSAPPAVTTATENPVSPMTTPPVQPIEPAATTSQAPSVTPTATINPAVISPIDDSASASNNSQPETDTPQPPTSPTPPEDADRPQPITPPAAPTENPIPPIAPPQMTQPSATPQTQVVSDTGLPNLSGLNATPQPPMTPPSSNSSVSDTAPSAPAQTMEATGEIKEDPQAMIDNLVQASDLPQPAADAADGKSDESVGALPPLPEI